MSAIDSVVIVGRDAPLWLAACVIQSALGSSGVKVTAVELPSSLCPHEAYATLPALEALHHQLRMDESILLGRTRGCFTLGQNFVDASGAVPSFFHAYGSYGAPIDQGAFFPYWLKARRFGLQVALEDFSLTATAARHGRMLIPDAATETYGRTDYGYHLPALAYASWLKGLALQRGVTRHEARQATPELDATSGAIVAVDAGDDRRLAGELFIDATGPDAGLIGAALRVPRESWREHFVADRRLVGSGPRFASIPPYSEIRACADGWLGLYPTQTHTHVVQTYSSALRSDDEALRAATTISGLNVHDAAVKVCDPGRRALAWERNCIAIGEAACLFDPIHNVEIQAVQIGLVHLLSLFPVSADYAAERTEYNRIVRAGFERLRDFQSAHYAVNRYSPAFWDKAAHAEVSPELTHRIETFRARGEVPLYENETFPADSWQALFVGHGLMPESYDPIVDRTSPETMKHEFRRILAFIRDKVREQTAHNLYLQSVCPGA